MDKEETPPEDIIPEDGVDENPAGTPLTSTSDGIVTSSKPESSCAEPNPRGLTLAGTLFNYLDMGCCYGSSVVQLNCFVPLVLVYNTTL